MSDPDTRNDRGHRTFDHAGMIVIPFDECYRLLGSRRVGRLGFVDAGTPVILPVNYTLDGRTVLLRTAAGSKLHVALMRHAVAFEVDEIDDTAGTGWSVLVRGTADLVEDAPDPAVARTLPDAWARRTPRPHWVAIRPDEVTGRRVP